MSWNAKKPDCDLVHEDRRLNAISNVQDSLVTKDEVDAAITTQNSASQQISRASRASYSYGSGSSYDDLPPSRLKTSIDWSQGDWNTITEVENGLILKVAYNLSDFVEKYDMIDPDGNVLSTYSGRYNSTAFHIKQYLFCPRMSLGLKVPFYNIYNTLYCPLLLGNPDSSQELDLLPTFKRGSYFYIDNLDLLTKTFLRRDYTSLANSIYYEEHFTLNLSFNFLYGQFQSGQPTELGQNEYYRGLFSGDSYPGHWGLKLYLTRGDALFATTGVSYDYVETMEWAYKGEQDYVPNCHFHLGIVAATNDTSFSLIQLCPQFSAYPNQPLYSPPPRQIYGEPYYTEKNQVPKDPYCVLSGNGYVPYRYNPIQYDPYYNGYRESDGVAYRLNGNSSYKYSDDHRGEKDFDDLYKYLTPDFILNNIETIV